MTYWPSRPWKISISQGHETSYIEPSAPFAIIGSHELCTARIDAQRLPDAVYLACAFKDSVEVWPLTAISFPRWGVLHPQHNIQLGKVEIAFRLDGTASKSFIQTDEAASQPPPARRPLRENLVSVEQPRIIIGCREGRRIKTLRRRVTIFGESHPSTLRLHGFGLTGCSHAIISVDGSVWLIDLSFRQFKPENQWVTLLDPMAPPHPIGDATIAVWSASTAPHRPESILIAARSPTCQVFSHSSDSLAAIDMSIDLDLLVPSNLIQPSTANSQQVNSQQTAGTVAGDSFSPATSSATTKNDRAADAELLATHITDRLADFQQIRLKCKRQINIACFAFVLLVLVPAICWPIFRVVLPLLHGDI